jgi:hypothetical protein
MAGKRIGALKGRLSDVQPGKRCSSVARLRITSRRLSVRKEREPT